MGFECCLHCPSTVRKVGCHSYCELYIEARKEMDEINRLRKEDQLKNSIFHQVGKPGHCGRVKFNPRGRKEFF